MSDETKLQISNSKIGTIMSDKTKQKISNFNKGKVVSEETKKLKSETSPNKKIIQQFDLDNNLLNEFDSITNASKILNIPRQTINNTLNGYSKTSKGFIFKYKNK